MQSNNDFGIYCHRSARPGTPAERRRGEIAVIDQDGITYFYRLPRGRLREFKRWFANTRSELRDHDHALRGRYPWYRVSDVVPRQPPRATSPITQLPAPVREFIDTIPNTQLLRPQKAEPWMEVEHFDSWRAAWRAARDAANVAAWRAARDAARAAACDAACRSGRYPAYHTAYNDARDAARIAARNAARLGACDVTRYAATCAADYAAALVVADLVDITWPHRWWAAWERGYIPLREDGDALAVAWAVTEEPNQSYQSGRSPSAGDLPKKTSPEGANEEETMETDDCAGIEELELPGPVREFVDRIAGTPFLRPQRPEEWMRIECFSDWKAAWEAARDAAYDAACDGDFSTAYLTAWRAAYNAAWDADRAAAWHAAYRTAWNAALGAAHELTPDVAWAASACAADYAAGLIVADLVDITRLYRRWRAWELGYIPIREDGDALAVAWPVTEEPNQP